MRSFITTMLCSTICCAVNAQTGVIATRNMIHQGDAVLTMEETILADSLNAQNRLYVWRADLQEFVTTQENSLVAQTPAGKERTILTLNELNNALNLTLEQFPRYDWIDNNTITFTANNRFYSFDIKDKHAIYSFDIPKGAAHFTPSPNREHFAYTKENNLYVCDRRGLERAIDPQDDPNIVTGSSVSRNEFGIDRGIFWSPNGGKLAFYRKDESAVSTFPLLDISTRTGSLVSIKYPMAGMASELVSLGVYDVTQESIQFIQPHDFDKERYLTNITWAPNCEEILIQELDRAQQNMALNLYSATSGEHIKTILTEHNDKYVEPLKPVVFLKNDPTSFLYDTDNRDGFRNLYLCDMDGRVERLTKVDADIDYIAQDGKSIYYYSAEVSAIERHLFKLELKSGKVTRLTAESGVHNVQLSTDCKYFIDNYSNITVPRVIALKSTTKQTSRALFEAPDPVLNYNYGEIVLGTVKSACGKYDNYYRLIKPADFDASKKYPVIVYVYGGPHSQMVDNSFLAKLRRWEMYMAQQGYVVYCQDNRGTSNRGAEFEKAIYGMCGVAEMEDQMEGIKMLKSLPYVDSERIGLHGWSYGGFMTISLLTHYPDVFKVAVAGGPVIDWQWYEVMYGERYMGHPSVNSEGYATTSLIPHAKDVKGRLLICQGAIDETVLQQHCLNFIQACIEAGVQVDYFTYPRHKHNVTGPQRVHLMDKVSLYFHDHL